MLAELDPLIHSQLRLAIMSILLSVDEADFVYLKEKTESTAGNLSVQLDKLSKAGIHSGRERVCRKKDSYIVPDYRNRQKSDGRIYKGTEDLSGFVG